MALEQTDIEQITNIVNQALDARSKGGDDKNKGNNGDDGKGVDDVAKIKAQAEAEKQREATLKSAISFNVGLSRFMEDNKRFLPDSINTVFTAYKGRQYGDEKEQADNYRKVILDEVFGDQKNIDLMPESAKERIMAYKGMPESDKQDKSGSYFDLIDTYLTIKKGTAQAAFNKTTQENDEYSSKFLKLGDNFKKQGA